LTLDECCPPTLITISKDVLAHMPACTHGQQTAQFLEAHFHACALFTTREADVQQ